MGCLAQATIPVPMHVGHEFVGEVVEVGKNVKQKNLAIGDRVSGEGHIVCGTAVTVVRVIFIFVRIPLALV